MEKFLTVVILLIGIMNVARAESADEFCWKYFATLGRDENIFYSPYGIQAALSILANGATGQTQAEILSALKVADVAALNDAHEKFSAQVDKNYGGENIFIESNLFLVDKKFAEHGLDENFQRVVADVYKSEVRTADFANNLDGEKKKISRFVSDKTNGFISDYESLVTSATLTDLLNVVYFKGVWKIPFEASLTVPQDFTNRDGSISEVDMMRALFEREVSCRADEKFCGIELPYSTGAAMYLILPSDENALNVAELWNAESFDYREEFLDGLKTSPAFDGNVLVRLPKFELDIENSLVDGLKALGIEKSFTDHAEFFNVVKGTQLKIDSAKHRAKVRVDEEGTEAAAVTEINMLATAVADPEPPKFFYFFADRPFVFVIRDVESGVTLFAGVVNNFQR